MRKKEDYKRLIILLLFGLLAAGALATASILTKQQTTSTQAASDLDLLNANCREGLYYAKSPVDGTVVNCGRAPNCGGYSYTDVTSQYPDHYPVGTCWLNQKLGIGSCDVVGFVPLCCYRMALTGNPKDCTWPERGFCHPTQCAAVGNAENCGGPALTYGKMAGCFNDPSEIRYISLQERIGLSQPTTTPLPTSTPQPPTPTNTRIPTAPTATHTPIPSNTPLPTVPQPTSTPQPTAPPGQPTYTPIPTATASPIPTAIRPTNQTSQPTTSVAPPQQVTLPPENNTNQPPVIAQDPSSHEPTTAPLEIKSPMELAREVINPQNVQKLNELTELPLEAPRKALTTIRAYDKKLEQTVERWIFPWRVKLLQFMQRNISPWIPGQARNDNK